MSSALLAIFAIFASGCVSVHIADNAGHVRTTRQVGLLKVEIANPEQAVVASLSGFGLVSAPLGWSAGYTRQRWALLGHGCRAVVWPEPGAIDEGTRNDLARVAGVCLLEDAIPPLATSTTTVTP